MARLANSYVEAEGTADMNSRITAGCKLKIDGCGSRFNGKYTVTSVTHVYSPRGHHTHFKASGRAARTLYDLTSRAAKRSWADGPVVGVVTNNQDPDNLGRVRVKFPDLGDNTEGWWARIASTSAGKDRGVLMMPQKDDEVLVVFEHGDARRAYVVGSLWNTKDTPGDLVQKDGSYVIQSDKKIVSQAKDNVSLKTDKDYSTDVTGKASHSTKGDFTIDSKGKLGQSAVGDITIDGKGNVTLKGMGSVTVKSTSSLTVQAPNVTVQGDASVSVKGGMISLG
jgi:uncharacterized protein involved in type VI secretion and phage assembly